MLIIMASSLLHNVESLSSLRKEQLQQSSIFNRVILNYYHSTLSFIPKMLISIEILDGAWTKTKKSESQNEERLSESKVQSDKVEDAETEEVTKDEITKIQTAPAELDGYQKTADEWGEHLSAFLYLNMAEREILTISVC